PIGVRLPDLDRNPPHFGDCLLVRGAPLPDLLRVAAAPRAAACPSAGAPGRGCPLVWAGAALLGVLLAQVGLVIDSVQSERDRRVAVRAVDIVHQDPLSLTCH